MLGPWYAVMRLGCIGLWYAVMRLGCIGLWYEDVGLLKEVVFCCESVEMWKCGYSMCMGA